MALTASWKATTSAGLLAEIAPIVRTLPGGYRRTIGRITWAQPGPHGGAEPVIALVGPTALTGQDTEDLAELVRNAYTVAHAVVFDDIRDAWENSPEAREAREALDADEPPAETCILPAAWDPAAAIALTGRDGVDDALTEAAADTANEWQPVHTGSPWTVAWAHI